MIDPLKCVEQILLNDPGLAQPLLDLLIRAEQPLLGDDNVYDDVLEMVYVKLQHCREAREAYIKGRRRPELQAVDAIAAGSH